MKIMVTGAAGFIGSTLTDRLLRDGHTVVGIDNFSTGLTRFLENAQKSENFELIQADLLEPGATIRNMKGVDHVFHLAANADVRFGTQHPRLDIEQNTIATHNVLEAMRLCGVKRISFSSTGSVYGEPGIFPTPEHAPFPVQTSLYAASKLAAEALISAYCEGFGVQAYIFRFVSILGERYTHGHVFDFYKQLLAHPDKLTVLGNGKQRKSYLYVLDCVDALVFSMNHTSSQNTNIYNLGAPEYCTVDDSIRWICERLDLKPTIEYTGGERGWVGDSPFIFLDCNKVRCGLGWDAKLSIRDGVEATVDFLCDNPWVLERP